MSVPAVPFIGVSILVSFLRVHLAFVTLPLVSSPSGYSPGSHQRQLSTSTSFDPSSTLVARRHFQVQIPHPPPRAFASPSPPLTPSPRPAGIHTAHFFFEYPPHPSTPSPTALYPPLALDFTFNIALTLYNDTVLTPSSFSLKALHAPCGDVDTAVLVWLAPGVLGNTGTF
ncbi:hypothetical protein NLJ89_g8206 [Agrocybe chaxingu]|uniref:Uncharacterized protein n=1 Tax=Agrocybe chaxingu TaxID=84603 RepID=A0A9W8JVN9_9AGAR|nr:hypothetical protein NLJ89_g8206 [Agrocybe chaxingu]